MAAISKIEWTESSWNPVTGCDRVSPGCAHCYAERMAHRLQRIGQIRYRDGFRVTLQEDLIDLPLKWKRPRLIFVNSMGDLFHENIPDEFIFNIFQTMQMASWHIFQILTKRSERLMKLSHLIDWPENVWMGVTAESFKYIDRIKDLQKVPAKVKFVSMEPLLGPIPKFPYKNIDWVIVGGESGPKSRPMEENWVLEIRNQCKANDIPFFFKQWGGVHKKKNGRLLEGKIWDETPKIEYVY